MRLPTSRVRSGDIRRHIRQRYCKSNGLRRHVRGVRPPERTIPAVTGRDRLHAFRQLALSWPAGAGTPGCRADRHPQAYAQAACRPCMSRPCGRRRRRGRLAYSDTGSGIARRGWRGGGGRSMVCGVAGRGAGCGSCASLVVAAAEPDRGQPLQQRHARFSGCGLRRPRRAGRGSRSAPASAVRRSAACAGRGSTAARAAAG